MNLSRKQLLTAAIIIVALVLVLLKYWDYLLNPWTRDGQIRAEVIQITPRVSGPIVKLAVKDNQFVKAGDLLFEIDPRTFAASLAQAQAEYDKATDSYRAQEQQVVGASAYTDASRAQIRQAQAAIMCPGAESHYRTAKPNRFLSVSIPVARLRRVVEEAAESSLEPLLIENRIVPMEQQAVAQLERWLRQAITFSAHTGQTTHGASGLADLEQHIVGALTLALSEHPDDMPRRITQRRQVFLRARDYIENNLAAPLGLEILARETGVSLRTLRYSFQQVLGLNPLHYIKLRRLSAARQLLLKGCPEELSVTAAALRCGFSHMSYFARDYQALFGESPSQTLGKHGASK